MKRILLCALGAVLLLAVLALGAGSWYVRAAVSQVDEARIPGLSAPVEVWRDSLGVPHLWARDEPDLARALGYVHAQDRLWQMDLLRRVADGRLAEVLGEVALSSDRFLRSIGMGRAAAAEERALDPASRALLQAYADGVNAWIEGHPGALPPEFLALRFRPAPWTVRHSLAIGKVMSWDLADWQIGLDLQRAVDRVGPALARDLLPRYPAWGPRIVDSAPTGAPPGARLAPGAARGVTLPEIPPLARGLLASASAASASNAWVVAGSRTRSGKPILANDPHLELRAPALWYLAALHGGPTAVAGVTIPGLPFVLLGHTERVAWGFTNAMVDDVDLFVERLDPADSTRYLTPDGSRPLEVRPETIQVRGRDPVVVRVRATRHGPVISDVEPRAGGRLLAMEWTALRPSTAFGALRAMNRARDTGELLAALRSFDEPHQNVVFADADGTIGYWMAGRVPLRRGGDGLLPAPGWTGEADWVGFAGPDRHPRLLDPAAGFVVTANNPQLGEDAPLRIGSYYADPYRAARIREMLEDARDLTADRVAGQQTDVVDLLARRYLPLAVRAAEGAGEDAAARALRAWDGAARADSRAAPLFYLWYETLRRAVSDDEYGGRGFFPRYALDRVLDSGGGAWVDDVRTPRVETLDELSPAAMRSAVRAAAGRSWGELHSTRVAHALGSVDALAGTLDLNLGPFPSPGSGTTVNVAGFGSEPPFVSSYGASMRHVVDLADPDGSGGFVLPGGQSGLPFSPHYRDQLPLWRAGRLHPLPLDRARAERTVAHRMTLRPD